MFAKLKTAIYLPNFGPFGDARIIADLARDAESAGWDGFFLWNNIATHDNDGCSLPHTDPWLALTAAAMETTSILLGTTVTPLPRRRPHKLARETVTLDRLSSGRLILSVGIGLGQREWDHLGEETDPQSRGRMLDEGLDILVGLWSGEPFHFNGEHYHIEEAQFLPPLGRGRRREQSDYSNKTPYLRLHLGLCDALPTLGYLIFVLYFLATSVLNYREAIKNICISHCRSSQSQKRSPCTQAYLH